MRRRETPQGHHCRALINQPFGWVENRLTSEKSGEYTPRPISGAAKLNEKTERFSH
jgi:hypothetical protein